MKPLCFILMPFGIKEDQLGRKIDFDKVYEQLIMPAIDQCGLEPIRADEELTGGIIHKPMFERLILCDYAIADLTSSNANVFYELGIRHAIRPYTTIPISAFDGPLPFDLTMQRTLRYNLDKKGNLLKIEETVKKLVEFIKESKDSKVDSPVYALLDNLEVKHNLSHEKTDSFREAVKYNKTFKSQLADARKKNLNMVKEVHNQLKPLKNLEAGVVVDLFLSYRGFEAWHEMISCYDEMDRSLQHTKMIQEQRGFALNRKGDKEKAIEVLSTIISEFGPDPETNGLLGRIYKDLWKKAYEEGKDVLAKGYLKHAIKQYKNGFDADWRDAYPGVNLVTLLAIQGDNEALKNYLPIVKFAVNRKVNSRSADYWDKVTQMELAVLEGNYEEAEDYLSEALTLIPDQEYWMAKTSANNLKMIKEFIIHTNNETPLNGLIDLLDNYKK